jgi:aspartyl-tRNA(Asn)/glutamyl-tRNA(Gln) amidotransferase subunit A
LSFASARELADDLRQGRTAPAEVLAQHLRRIERFNPRLNAFVGVEARDGDAERAREAAPRGKLAGIPVAVKDNICVRGWETTCASRILEGFRSPYDATVIVRLREEGAVLVGRTNMDEFAFGSSCETSCYGPTRNPWDPARSPGGSSGGSAAAVAADLAPLALGSDTGGSIRQPASFCGIVGLKPTYGRVSRYGLVAFGSSLDQIGPMARTVEDAALLLQVIAGFDPQDSTSADRPVPDYLRFCGEPVKGMRVGIPREYFGEALSAEVKKAVDAAVGALKGKGVEFREVSLPHTEYAVPVYYIIAPSEASSNLARFDGVKYGYRDPEAAGVVELVERTRGKGFGAEAKRRILLGTYALSSGYYDAYYLKAMRVRRRILEDFERAFHEVDCLVTPTSPTPAFKIGEKTSDPLSMYLSDIYTISANLAGVPALSMPCGLSSGGLPVGIQFTGRPFEEGPLLRLAFALQEKLGTRKLRPKMDFA